MQAGVARSVNKAGICTYAQSGRGNTPSRVAPQESSVPVPAEISLGQDFLLSQNKKGAKTMSEQTIPYKIYLEENEMPTAWYNVRADMKNKPAPLLNPGTHQPMTAEELGGVFCEELVAQELDNENAYIEIPAEIRDFYKMYRPSPLVRAYCLEKKLDTPAKIY